MGLPQVPVADGPTGQQVPSPSAAAASAPLPIPQAALPQRSDITQSKMPSCVPAAQFGPDDVRVRCPLPAQQPSEAPKAFKDQLMRLMGDCQH